MNIFNRRKNRLKNFWVQRFPHLEKDITRYANVGLLPQDFNLTDLETICVLSIMAEKRTIHQVFQAIELFRNETVEPRFHEGFLEKIQETISEMERSGFRAQSAKLRKIGLG
ncbi:MAG: hypothetical protein PVI99_10700, partial [Anaerolineales bacterium]